MRELKFNVNQQTIMKTGDFNHIVRGSKGYLVAVFNFSEDWNGYNKVASFYKKDGVKAYNVILEGNRCTVPDEVTDSKYIYVRVTGGSGNSRIYTNQTIFRQEG